MSTTAEATQQNCPTILIAEDNQDHVILMRRAFAQARFLNPVKVVNDGLEAIAYLKGEGRFADRTQYPLPALLLLDLKMPNKNGFEVMEWIRTQPALAHLRIVVLTTSDRVFDMQHAYELGASSFLTKPLDMRDFIQLAPAIKGCWTWNVADGSSPSPDYRSAAG
jgi:CheY-like chemotaxis protein